MRFVGRGHPAIRATHDKTLELSPDEELTARATCIVAVAVEPDPLAPMAGRIRLRIAAGGERFSLEADANSSWDPSGPAVIRRSPVRLPGTFATGASASSADLPRELVAALQDPDTLVTVDVVAVPADRETVVLFAADPTLPAADERLRAEVRRADTIEGQDAAARRLLASARPDAAAATDSDSDSDSGPGPGPGSGSGSGPGPAARHLVVATTELPRNTHPGAAIEVVGLGAQLAAAAASPTPGPLALAGPDDDVRMLLRTTPAAHRLVLGTEHARLDALLELARTTRGSSACVVAQQLASPLRIPDAGTPELPSRDHVYVCFDAAPAQEALDPAVRAAVGQLLADGVATRTAARALATLSGWDRRRAYDAVVDWRSD